MSSQSSSNGSESRDDKLLRYSDSVISGAVIVLCIIGIRNIRTRINNRRIEYTAQYQRDTERQQRIHAEWLHQQNMKYQQQLHNEQYIESIERARRNEFVEDTYKHAQHNWSYSKRYKPPHYSTWGMNNDSTQHTYYQYNHSDNSYNNTVQPLNASDINARAVLGIDIHTSNAELNEKHIKHQYRQKAKKSHPDLNGGDAHKFNEITDAYNILINAVQSHKHNKKQQNDYG